MKLNWLFKSNESIANDILKQYNSNPDNFIQKYLDNQPWRDEISKALWTFIGHGVTWINDTPKAYVDDGYRKNAAVYSIINLITREAKKVKWQLYEIKDDTALTRLKNMSHTNKKYKAIRKKALQLIDNEGHDLLRLLNFRANPLRSGAEFQDEVLAYKLITGNSYIYMAGPGEDKPFANLQTADIEAPQELWSLPAHMTRILSGDEFEPIQGYEIMFRPSVPLPAARIMHSKFFNPDYTSSTGSQLYGMSPLKAGARTLTASNDSYLAAAKLLQNLGALGIVYKESGQDFTQANAQTLQRQWEAKTGPQQVNKLLFAGAKLGWLKISESASDLSLYEGIRTSTRELANLYGISTILLNDIDNNSTYKNYAEAKKSMITNSVLPHLTDLRDLYNYRLVPLFEKRDNVRYFLDLDVSSIPELAVELSVMADIANKAWWLDINEKRDLMGYDEDENLDGLYLVPSNLIPVSETSLTFSPSEEDIDMEDDNMQQTDPENDEQKLRNPIDSRLLSRISKKTNSVGSVDI